MAITLHPPALATLWQSHVLCALSPRLARKEEPCALLIRSRRREKAPSLLAGLQHPEIGTQALLILPIANSRNSSAFRPSGLIGTTSQQLDTLLMQSITSNEDDARLVVTATMRPELPAPTKKKKTGKARALSTERSRQCRERQKLYSENLEAVVRALHTEVRDLEILRSLRREQCLQLRGSVSGSLAKIVREYMTVFRHGMPAPTVEAATAGIKRALPAVAYQPSPDAQCEFLNCIMDPYVEVFDWCGRFVLGASTLLNGWTAWAAWHDSLSFELVDIDVVDTEDTLAVTTKANLRVRVSQKTIEQLFRTFWATNCCAICYPIRDYETVLFLMSPPDQASLNDLAVRTSPGDLAENSLDVEFLLSEDDSPVGS
ncbi:hypothetical protein GQ600_26506 [Phytophthora cactorum]|nr:hypothetical protein GQ600_26506 [Phytophthora cactorum]